MAAPAESSTQLTGVTDAGGAWAWDSLNTPLAGEFVVLAILQDGTSSNTAIAITGAAGIENLAGTINTWTQIGTTGFAVGSATAAYLYLYLGRSPGGATTVQASGTNSGTDDIYVMGWAFTGVGTGTTVASVIENVTAGATVSSVGTSALAADAGVTTTGVDRLAVNVLGINDDNPFAGFTGQTGGTWTTSAFTFVTATGTDAALYLTSAPIATAGTINGGTGSITDIDAWGAVGFALIPPVASGNTYTKAGYAIESV